MKVLYIDFENFWYVVLDYVDEFLSRFDFEKLSDIQSIQRANKVKKVLDKFLNKLINIDKFDEIKAYGDFNSLYALKELKSYKFDVKEFLENKGIVTKIPFITPYKDMTDRVLIIDLIRDFYEKDVDEFYVVSGDIDYYPLFEFLINKKKRVVLVTFRVNFSSSYKLLRGLEIIEIDDLIKIDSLQKRIEKKNKMINDFIDSKNLNRAEPFDYIETIENLESHYYLKFEDEDLERLSLIKEER